MIQIEQGTWVIPIAPQGAVEHTFASRKLDLNAAYAVDILSIAFPVKKGEDPTNPNAARIAKAVVNVLEPGFEGIERDLHLGLPQPIPQNVDPSKLRSLLFPHENWYNLLLSIGYAPQQATQIMARGVQYQDFVNAPGRGRAYIYVEEDEYDAPVKNPTTNQPVMDPNTGAVRTEKRQGENRMFCSPGVHAKSSAAAARAAKGNTQGSTQSTAPGGFQPPATTGGFTGGQPSFSAPAQSNYPSPQVPNGGFAAPAPIAGGSPFAGPAAGVPNGAFGGVPAGSPAMNTLMQPRA